MISEPLDFIARQAASIPKPRVNLARYHDVFAPNSKHRAMGRDFAVVAGRMSECSE